MNLNLYKCTIKSLMNFWYRVKSIKINTNQEYGNGIRNKLKSSDTQDIC